MAREEEPLPLEAQYELARVLVALAWLAVLGLVVLIRMLS